MKANPTLRERTLSATITTPSGGIMPAHWMAIKPANFGGAL
jgi:hypothetical protein